MGIKETLMKKTIGALDTISKKIDEVNTSNSNDKHNETTKDIFINNEEQKEIRTLKCPECGASLEMVRATDVMYCSFCGAKVLLTDPDVLDSTVKIRKIEAKENIVTKLTDAVNKHEEIKRTERSKQKKIAFIVLICFIVLYGGFFIHVKRESDRMESELKNIVIEIQEDINAGDYDSALLKANRIHYTSNWSRDKKQAWDDVRKAVIKLIEEKKAQNPTPSNSSEPVSTNESASQTESGSTDGFVMPVMKGTSLSVIKSESNSIGINEVEEEFDSGHDTISVSIVKKRDLAQIISVDVVYNKNTGEILMGEIITWGNDNLQEQKDAITYMCRHLCPSDNSEEVLKWVNNNLGNETHIVINGRTYELTFGPVGNYIFYAGEHEWAEWSAAVGE